MRGVGTRHLSPDTCQSPQRLVDVARRRLSRRLARELHAGGDRRVRRHARQRAQLIRAESQDVVEQGIGGREHERAVELGLAPQDACSELVGEPAVALAMLKEIARRFASALPDS